MSIDKQVLTYQIDGTVRKADNDQDDKRPARTSATVFKQFLIHIAIVVCSFGLLYIAALVFPPNEIAIIVTVIVIFVVMLVVQIAVGVRYYKKYFETSFNFDWILGKLNFKKETKEKSGYTEAKNKVWGYEETIENVNYIEAKIDEGIKENVNKPKEESLKHRKEMIAKNIETGRKMYGDLMSECQRSNTQITSFTHRVVALTIGSVLIFGMASVLFYMFYPENENINAANIAIAISSSLVTIATTLISTKRSSFQHKINSDSIAFYSAMIDQYRNHEDRVRGCRSHDRLDVVLSERREEMSRNLKAIVEVIKAGKRAPKTGADN